MEEKHGKSNRNKHKGHRPTRHPPAEKNKSANSNLRFAAFPCFQPAKLATAANFTFLHTKNTPTPSPSTGSDLDYLPTLSSLLGVLQPIRGAPVRTLGPLYRAHNHSTLWQGPQQLGHQRTHAGGKRSRRRWQLCTCTATTTLELGLRCALSCWRSWRS